jgi:metal-dependent hydrolase (beta-lactamase superfamily II)
MPPGAPYNSFVVPYRIRVDEFTNSIGQEMVPALHLLSHTHSDHITGLQAKSFGYTVICSHDAKEMLLRHEVYAERSLHEQEYRAETTRTYSHLKVDPLIYPDGSMYYTGSRDLLVRTAAVSERIRLKFVFRDHCRSILPLRLSSQTTNQ